MPAKSSRRNTHNSPAAQAQHGVENFVFTHFADAFDENSAKSIERMLIVEHNTMAPHGYNLTEGGDGTFGYKHTEESKEKSRASNKKTWDNSPALKKAIGDKNKLLKTGVPSPLKGKPSGRKGIPHSAQHVANLKTASNTPESKEKHRNAVKAALNDPAWKAAQSARLKAIWAIRKAQKETA